MSTISLAAQRSYTTGEAVWFSYRLPSMKRVLGGVLATILAILTIGILVELVVFAPLERRMLRNRGLLQGATA